MKFSNVRCSNMNHGRTNAPVKYCPTCGDVVNRSAAGSCDQTKHASLRKERYCFCFACGVKLTAA